MVRDIVIWGLHRSGTSVLATCLAALGWRFGNVNLTPTVQNPRGFQEHYGVVELNERLMRNLGTRWDDWAFDLGAADLGGPGRSEDAATAANILWSLSTGDADPWAIKDPRLVGLARFWLPLFEDVTPAPVHVVLYRHPSEVSQSLLTRGMEMDETDAKIRTLDDANAFWTLHLLSLLKTLSGREVLFLDHRDLIGRAETVLGQVATFAGRTHDTACLSEAAALVDAGLYRSHSEAVDHVPWRDQAEELFKLLGSIPGDQSDVTLTSEMMRKVSAVWPSFGKSCLVLDCSGWRGAGRA